MAIVATHVAAVQELYVAYFGRPADPAGLDYWTNIVEAQGSTAAVSATFAESDEYQDAFEGMTNTQIVNQIYLNMFGREAEATGRDYWVKLLDEGKITVDNIVADVAKAAVGTDGEAVENKVAAATAFTAALDTEAEVAGYAGEDALALAKAFIKGVTDDASLTAATAPAALNATVAAVVAAGTDFTLEGAMAAYSAAVEAKSAVLADLAEDEAVAEQLETNGVTGTATDAQILKAIADIDAAGDTGINGFITGFSGLTTAQQSARISSLQADNAATLRTQTTTLNTRTTAVEAVDNLAAAYDSYKAAGEAEEAAQTAADLADAAETAAVRNFEVLAKGTVSEAGGTYTFTGAAGAKDVFSLNAAGTAYVLESGVTEANYAGVTAALAAVNASLTADLALTEAQTDLTNATTGVDILDSADKGVNLAAVAKTFAFTTLGTDVLPTYEQILAEEEFFDNQIDALNAAVGGAGYKAAIDQLSIDVDAIIADAAGTSAQLATVLKAAQDAKVLTAAQVKVVTDAYAADKTTADEALDSVNWIVKKAAFDGAVQTLLTNELTTEAGIGNLISGLTGLEAAENAIEGTNTSIANFAAAVEAYNAAQALNGSVAAADAAIAAAVKVFTTEGFVAPVTLSAAVTLSTANDDLFLVGSSNVSLRNFGSQGDDVLYVGNGLTYNDTEIGSGTGQTALKAAGDDSVLEFFLEQVSNGVRVIVEGQAFGSTSGTDTTVITLVGVDLEDLVIENGFITV